MAWGLSLLAAALLVNTFAGSLYTRTEMKESTARLQSEVALFTARRLQNFIRREIDRLEEAGAAIMMVPLGGEQQRRLANVLLARHSSIEEAAIINRSGDEVVLLPKKERNPSTPTSRFGKSAAFFAALQGRSYVKASAGTRLSEPSWVTLAVPLKNGSGAPVGALVARAKLDFLRQVVSEVKFGRRGYAYLVDSTGLLIAHPDPSFTMARRSLLDIPKVKQFLTMHGPDLDPGAEAEGIAGDAILSTFARIPDLGWGVIVEEPLAAVMARVHDLYFHASALLAVGLLAGAFLIVWLSHRITRPIQMLRDSVAHIRHGDFTHRADIRTGDEIEELADDFNSMTEALERSKATLEQRVEQRTQEISALYEVTAMVSQTLDVEAVFDAVIKKITALFGFDTTRVYVHDTDSDLISLRGCFEVNPELWVSLSSFKRGQSVVGRVVETGEPMIFEDLINVPAHLDLTDSPAHGMAGVGFLAAFPIKTKHSCYGALVFSGKSSRSLKPEEIRLLSSMAEQIGVAVENSSLYQQARTKSEHLMVLHQVAAAVSRFLDLEKVLSEALDRVVGILRFDAGWVYMLDAEEKKLQLKAHKGLSRETVEMLDVQSVRNSISKTVISREPPLAANGGLSEHYRAVPSRRVQPRDYRGSIAVPIKSRDKAIGVLYAVNWESRRYTADDLGLIESVAQEIGVAVENAKLFAEIKKQSSELAKINAELRAATQAKSEFIAAMSHELRTPLSIMIGSADVTHDGIFGDINDEQKTAMRKIARNGRVLLKMINDLLKLSRIEANRMVLEPTHVDVAEVLQHAREQIAELNRDGRLEIGWHVDHDLPSLFTDPGKFEEILHNLIGNAFKFTSEGRINIFVKHQADQQRVEVAVVDTGIGIEPEKLAGIFEKFEQINHPGKTKNDGVGLGLSIVKKYLELMQGEIRVESTPGEGSRFIFWLPYSISLESADVAPLNARLTS